jgi:hypothetical protein
VPSAASITGITTAASGAASGAPSNLTPTLPAGVATGGLLVAFTHAGGPRNITPPGGWTLALDGGTLNAHCNVYRKLVAAGETAPTFSCDGNSWAIILVSLSTPDAVPVEGATRMAATGATSVTAPSLTPGMDNGLYLASAMYPNSGQAWSEPGSMTENLDAAAPSGVNNRLLVASEVLPTAGAPSGTRLLSCGVAGVALAGAAMIVRPGVAVAVGTTADFEAALLAAYPNPASRARGLQMGATYKLRQAYVRGVADPSAHQMAKSNPRQVKALTDAGNLAAFDAITGP